MTEQPQDLQPKRLQAHILDERERRLIEYDNANPEVGPGITMFGYSRKLALEQLIEEDILPADYVDTDISVAQRDKK